MSYSGVFARVRRCQFTDRRPPDNEITRQAHSVEDLRATSETNGAVAELLLGVLLGALGSGGIAAPYLDAARRHGECVGPSPRRKTSHAQRFVEICCWRLRDESPSLLGFGVLTIRDMELVAAIAVHLILEYGHIGQSVTPIPTKTGDENNAH